jgi:predicted O-methyltransferase YrrM
MVALDEDKCQIMYLPARQSNAQNIVEMGTSFGVSTIYLAADLRDNGSDGIVYGTENEPTKAEKAKAMWAETDLSNRIHLLEGNLLETLTPVDRPVDMVLLDIWTPMALPGLLRVKDKLTKDAIVLSGNTTASQAGYKDLIAFLRARSCKRVQIGDLTVLWGIRVFCVFRIMQRHQRQDDSQALLLLLPNTQ